MLPNEMETIINAKRMAERGLRKAQYEMNSVYIDIFQHIIDELETINYKEQSNNEITK